jgi:hypothetical protein
VLTGGRVVGTSVGATIFFGGFLETGLLSPPLLPITGAPVVLGNRRNPILSAGTGSVFPPKMRRITLGETINRTRRIAATRCKLIDAMSDPGDRRFFVSAEFVRAPRKVFTKLRRRR